MGSVDSPFLAINTVHHHVDQITETEPKLAEAAQFIKNIYMLMTLLERQTQLQRQQSYEKIYKRYSQ